MSGGRARHTHYAEAAAELSRLLLEVETFNGEGADKMENLIRYALAEAEAQREYWTPGREAVA